MRLVLFPLLFSALLTPGPAASQDKGERRQAKEGSYEPLVHPIVGGSTDIGFVGGLTGVLTRLSPLCTPFCWKVDATVSFSLKPEHDTITSPVHFYDVRADIPGLAHGRARLVPRVHFKRLVGAGFFGIGNASQLEGAADVVPLHRYQYGQLQAAASLGVRLTLSGPLFANVVGGFAYVVPKVYEDSALERALETDKDRVLGTAAHSRPSVELGLGYDSRDDEANPQQGMYHTLSARLVPGSFTSQGISYGELSTEMRFFHPFIGEKLVGAMALWGRLLSSDAPFDELALGHVRGVPGGRYHGKIQMAFNLELRSLFVRFSIRKQRFGLGAVLLVDGGRVWADYRIDERLDGRGPGIHIGSGGGLRILWGKTRVLRFDVAYSEQKALLNPHQPLGMYLRVNQYF
ncbi:MAG: outer membrane protein assembly factor [Myxococcota bacterium]|jgi:hypothetical protein|nr:outer membrane protein assembly factor [Myxococcota bacterium]